jgi:hypothetical protein
VDQGNARPRLVQLLRIYGPEKPAFDGTWTPGDFEEVK